MSLENKSIENFLQSSCRFISTEERAKDIQDELRDHISSYIEEYTQEGMAYDESVDKALKQMGDPYLLSKMYKDKSYKSKRLFKSFLLSVALIVCLVFTGLDVYLKQSNVIFPTIISILLVLSYGTFIFYLIKAHKEEKILSKKEPIFCIQSYKQSTWNERTLNFIKYFIISMFILIVGLSLLELKDISQGEIFKHIVNDIRSCSIFLLLIILYSILSPKESKNVVYEDGIITLISFVPFENISSYKWIKEHVKNNVCHSIELKVKKKNKYSNNTVVIKVSSKQMNLVDELFKSKNVKCM